MQELEHEIYAHVLQRHGSAVDGVAEAIQAEKTSADGLHRRAVALMRTPLMWCALAATR